MIIEKIPFEINFPLKIFKNRKINFKDKKEREKIFKRHVYYYKYGKNKNHYLEERSETFLSLTKELENFLRKKYSHLNILSISIFGSSLYSKNNGDFDFLVITEGNIFSYDETQLTIMNSGKEIKCPVGISIKGIENFSKGVFDSKSDISLNLQSQIIYRTAISLFRRHIPIKGYDFVKNKKVFLRNGYAQVSDLLSNAYELYYLKEKRPNMKNRERARKILSRTYEAISYMNFLEKDNKVKKFKQKISTQIEKGATFKESKDIFNKIVSFYKTKIQHSNKNFRNKKKVLTILLNTDAKKHIKERLENYWKHANLPHQWIDAIIKILSKYYHNEDLAVEKIRKKFPSIINKDSQDYSKKLKNFRKTKIKNLAKRIKKDICGELIADVGGRSDDFAEQILHSNKNIKRAYVTDLCSFTTRSKNLQIDFIVQSSLTKMPFPERTIDTIILSMVLHHLKRKHQKRIIKNLISYLKNKGRIILIEDTYPKKINPVAHDKITKDFLKFKPTDRQKILYFYDWFGNRLMRNRDNIQLFYNYNTMEEWKKTFEKCGMKQIKAEFIKENLSHPDIFPPKAILVFKKPNN